MQPLATTLLLLALAPVSRANQAVLVASRNARIEGNVYTQQAFVGLAFGDDSNDLSWRGVLAFDLSSIPQGSRVNGVQVTLTVAYIDQAIGFAATAWLRRGLVPWVEGQTAACSPWPCGGAFVPTNSAIASVWYPLGSPSVFPSTPGLVADVQGWVDAPGSNHGWFLDSETGLFHASFFDRLSATPPTITIDYDPPCAAPTTYCVAAPNASGPGAFIGSAGSTRISDHDFRLVVTGCSPNAPGFYFFGAGQQQTPWGDGYLCVDAPFFRLLPAVFADAQGTAVRPIDFGTGSAAVIAPGTTWNFQYKYRDIVPGGAGFNASDALSATFCP